MKIYMSPQVNTGKKIIYSFEGEVITATFEEITDIFDFTDMPLGTLDSVETTLSVNPMLRAERKDDGLYITLLNFIDDEATHDERFPDWIEV